MSKATKNAFLGLSTTLISAVMMGYGIDQGKWVIIIPSTFAVYCFFCFFQACRKEIGEE